MDERWQKRILILAAAWNLIGGASALFDPAQHFAQLYTTSLSLDDPLQLFFWRCTWINAIAWGAAYLIAAFMPGARAPVLIAGGAGKIVYAVACFALYASGVGKSGLRFAGVVDLVLAALFVAMILSRRRVTAPG